MKKNFKLISIGILMVFMLVIGNAQANEVDVNIPITADQAFDAYADQVDPLTGEEASVAIVDVRTGAEYYWLGAPAQVDKIVTVSGKELLPYNGKVKLRMGGRYLKFKVEKGDRLCSVFLPVSKVDSIATTKIAYYVPLLNWDEVSYSNVENENYAQQIEALAADFNTIILMCRSGGRSGKRDFNTSLFKAIYEIDQPDGTSGRGGFEGTTYSNAYNGYRGFPGRYTNNQEHPSVSWRDAGLPIQIGGEPLIYQPE
jgi:rhodanese-related sulfurtransferase